MVFFGLDAEEYDRKYSDRELLRRVAREFAPHRRGVVLVAVALTSSTLANGLNPLLASRLLGLADGASNAGAFLSALVALAVGILALNASGFLLNYVTQRTLARVVSDVVAQLRSSAVRNVLRQDLSFFDQNAVGRLVSRVNSDTGAFGEVVHLVAEAASSVLVVAVLFAAMAAVNGALSLVFLATVPPIFGFTSLFRKQARRRTLLGQRALASVNALVRESLAGIQVAKTFRQEATLFGKFDEVNQQCYRVNFSRAIFLNLLFPGLQSIQAVALALLVRVGGAGIVGGWLSAADLFLFVQSLWVLFFPLFAVASFWPQFQVGLGAAERVFSLVDATPVVRQAGGVVLPRVRGRVEFRDLGFAYDLDAGIDETRWVFRHFNLEVAPGESVAIVGHTGAGKSSLANLLVRFYEFQEGDVLVDGVSIRDVELATYRRQVVVIPQEPFLFADTLENNVRYGRPDATREEVLAALEAAGGTDWVDDLPEGLDTNVRERGKLLSAGQRQLVALARALLVDPALLVLDEATSSVDPFTETRIQEAVERLMGGRTTIVIAHRLWTVRRVDRIVVLDHGRIVEQGSHDQLVAAGGHYAELYDAYFRHQSWEFLENPSWLRRRREVGDA
ncbi:MAG: ABC transporter ATP-binding protein [Promethearchaeota archaeon]